MNTMRIPKGREIIILKKEHKGYSGDENINN